MSEVYTWWGHWLGLVGVQHHGDLDLTFDLARVTLIYKILSRAISETVRCRKLILVKDIGCEL